MTRVAILRCALVVDSMIDGRVRSGEGITQPAGPLEESRVSPF